MFRDFRFLIWEKKAEFKFECAAFLDFQFFMINSGILGLQLIWLLSDYAVACIRKTVSVISTQCIIL